MKICFHYCWSHTTWYLLVHFCQLVSPFNLLQTWQCWGREAWHLGLPLRILQQERARLLHKAEDQGQEHQQGCLPRALLSWGILVKYCSFKESIWICFPGISASEGLQGVLDSPPWPVCRRLHRDGQPTVFAAFTHMQVALIYIYWEIFLSFAVSSQIMVYV